MSAGRWTCEQCAGRFDREKSGTRPIRFCGSACYHAWRKANGVTTGQFPKGLIPWNKDLKGLHLSPASEFKKGCEARNRLPVGSETMRYRRREGHARAYVKVAEPNAWKQRAVVIWERHNGPLPAGWVVHHRDRNPINDCINNLQAMTKRDHIAEHRNELAASKAKAKLAGTPETALGGLFAHG